MGLSKNQKVIFDILNLLNNNNIKLFDSKEILSSPNPNDNFVFITINFLHEKSKVHRLTCTHGSDTLFSLAGNFTDNSFSIGLIKNNDLPTVKILLGTSCSDCAICNP